VIMPKEIIDNAEEDGIFEYIGTGPFKFIDWNQDQHIHLARFDDYKPVDTVSSGLAGKKEALVNDLYFHVVTDPQTRMSGIETGQYDVGLNMDPDGYEQLKQNDNIETHLYPVGDTIVSYNER